MSAIVISVMGGSMYDIRKGIFRAVTGEGRGMYQVEKVPTCYILLPKVYYYDPTITTINWVISGKELVKVLMLTFQRGIFTSENRTRRRMKDTGRVWP